MRVRKAFTDELTPKARRWIEEKVLNKIWEGLNYEDLVIVIWKMVNVSNVTLFPESIKISMQQISSELFIYEPLISKEVQVIWSAVPTKEILKILTADREKSIFLENYVNDKVDSLLYFSQDVQGVIPGC